MVLQNLAVEERRTQFGYGRNELDRGHRYRGSDLLVSVSFDNHRRGSHGSAETLGEFEREHRLWVRMLLTNRAMLTLLLLILVVTEHLLHLLLEEVHSGGEGVGNEYWGKSQTMDLPIRSGYENPKVTEYDLVRQIEWQVYVGRCAVWSGRG